MSNATVFGRRPHAFLIAIVACLSTNYLNTTYFGGSDFGGQGGSDFGGQTVFAQERAPATTTPTLKVPTQWQYSSPLISAEIRKDEPSHAQKDPTVVFHDGRWHVFMTVKLPERSAIEHCSFSNWNDADQSKRTLLDVSDSDYFCAPQVFYFTPHKKWYLVYQAGMPDTDKMWVAYSTTVNIDDPLSWTRAKPMLDGGPNDPRTVGGLDYWIICDEEKAHLFFTSLNGKMWRMWTDIEQFPHGFDHCEVALQAKVFEASHTYRVKDTPYYLTVIEQKGRRHFKSYLADSLAGPWRPLADTEAKPFAGMNNVRPAPGVQPWTDNISHGELIRHGHDQTLTIDPTDWRVLFQGMIEKDKNKKRYGAYQWRLGMLKPDVTQ
ncbi:non-reducing end alpha-L-arabinofuranosidase family hydrolase [Planctomycetes bacterium K23_9]|uniref:non-reducing end alpha-L-arabinofuranosidase n=1 Tax=Stieleria marina TaxID=1930275 RepID=A0A517NM35_9BACT|nr:Alpha-L-arabinofuranosidase C precursor [Planctomycetes bacterium K23_9]